jgi:hypothetical protein
MTREPEAVGDHAVVPQAGKWWAIARTLLPLLFLAIEASSLAPWSHLAGLLLVSGAERPPVSARGGLPPLIPDAVLIVSIVGAWTLRRFAPGRRSIIESFPWRRHVATIGAIVAVAGGAVLSLHLYDAPTVGPTIGWFGNLTAGHEAGALVCAVAFMGLVWWRGTAVGAGSAGDRRAGFRAVIVGASITVASAVAMGVMPSLLGNVIPIAATTAIPAMIGALALASLEESQLPRSGGLPSTAPDRSWLGMVVALCLGVAVIGAVIALILGGQAALIVYALRAVGAVIGATFVLVASIAIIPVLWFAEWLSGLMKGSRAQPLDMPLSGLGKQSFLERFEETEPRLVIDPAITEVGLAIVALVVVAVVVWRLLRPAGPPDMDGAESEERFSVFSWTSLLRKGDTSARSADAEEDIDSVRRAYRTFLESLARRGVIRAPTETPYQLANRVRLGSADAVTNPSADADVATLTNSYVAVRYGTTAPKELEAGATAASRRLAAPTGS